MLLTKNGLDHYRNDSSLIDFLITFENQVVFGNTDLTQNLYQNIVLTTIFDGGFFEASDDVKPYLHSADEMNHEIEQLKLWLLDGKNTVTYTEYNTVGRINRYYQTISETHYVETFAAKLTKNVIYKIFGYEPKRK